MAAFHTCESIATSIEIHGSWFILVSLQGSPYKKKKKREKNWKIAIAIHTLYVKPNAGVEPATLRLRVSRSADWASRARLGKTAAYLALPELTYRLDEYNSLPIGITSVTPYLRLISTRTRSKLGNRAACPPYATSLHNREPWKWKQERSKGELSRIYSGVFWSLKR